MPEILHADLLTPESAANGALVLTAPNGVRYATMGRLDAPHATPQELERLTGTVPSAVSQGLSRFVYLFVPLVLSSARLAGDDSAPFSESDGTLIAPAYTASLADKAICHRNASIGTEEFVFLSSRLHNDRFALAFEFFVNVAHNLVDTTGIPASFGELVWKQAKNGVRGETSQDAWEERAEALGQAVPGSGSRLSNSRGTNERARSAYQTAAFADALAIYLLSLYLDFDYADLREREYPLLAASALAERLQAMHKLFPPNAGYAFQILYRRRS